MVKTRTEGVKATNDETRPIRIVGENYGQFQDSVFVSVVNSSLTSDAPTDNKDILLYHVQKLQKCTIYVGSCSGNEIFTRYF